MENTHSAAKSEAEKWGKPAIPWFHNRWVSHGFSRCPKILYCNPKNRERKVGNIEILGKTSSNSHPRKSTFFQWLKTLTDKSDIVSDIPSGSVYGVCINNYIYILTFYLTFFLAYALTLYLTFYLASILTYFLAYVLAFYLASFQAFILPFYLASIMTFYLTFYLAF